MTDTPPEIMAHAGDSDVALVDGIEADMQGMSPLDQPPPAHSAVGVAEPDSETMEDLPAWSFASGPEGAIASDDSPEASLQGVPVSEELERGTRTSGRNLTPLLEDGMRGDVFDARGQVDAPTRAPIPHFGPSGTRRNLFFAAFFSVVTLGIYGVVWLGRVTWEMRDFDPRMVVAPGKTRTAVAIPYIVSLLGVVAGADRLIAPHLSHAIPYIPMARDAALALAFNMVALGPALLLLPFALIGLVLTAERVRIVEDRVGVTPEAQVRPTSHVWLLLIPAIGGMWYMLSLQSRLNRVWATADEWDGVATTR